MSVEMRASDEDRQRVIDALQRHTAAGRLTLDEFSDRVGAVYTARTLGDLTAVTGDLPAEAPGPEATDPPAHSSHRELLAVFAAAIITLLLLALFMALKP